MERLDMRIGAGLRAVTAGAGVRALAPWLAATALLGAATTAQAGNFPPVAKAAATPYEALLGEVVLFDSAGTFDPDDGPQPLTLDWDLGDGTVASGPQTSHAYDTLGLHTAVLTASDGVSTTLAFIDVVVVLPPTATAPRHSAALVLSPDQTELAVANTDSDSVSIVSVDRRSVVELEVGDAPLSLAYADDGSALVVACGGDRGLWHVDPVAGTAARSTELPSTPGELVALADGRVLVTLPSLAAVAIVDDGEVSLIATAASPRAIAVDAGGTTAWVTHFLTTGDHGLVSRVDLQTGELVGEITLAEDLGPDTTASGRGFPNLLGTAVLTPAGDALWVGGLKSNTGRGAFVDGNDLTPHNRVRGAMFAIDAVGGELELTTRRLDTNDADSVAAIAFSPRGRYAYLLHRGAGMLSVYDLPKAALVDASDGSVASFETRIDLGHVPDAIAITDDGTRAWVRNELTRDVMELDLTEPTAAAVVATIAVTDEPLSPQLLLGKQMFNRSRGPEHSEQNYIACASCHPSGGHDGRTWDFTQTGEGLRNTIDLRGHAGMESRSGALERQLRRIQDFERHRRRLRRQRPGPRRHAAVRPARGPAQRRAQRRARRAGRLRDLARRSAGLAVAHRARRPRCGGPARQSALLRRGDRVRELSRAAALHRQHAGGRRVRAPRRRHAPAVVGRPTRWAAGGARHPERAGGVGYAAVPARRSRGRSARGPDAAQPR
ncbi:MAG: PKD domain-containing protein [Deltaproteobacteria bacterium]|nr:PKD domain-containing protein [Deltaproteobacteria bacterium]